MNTNEMKQRLIEASLTESIPRTPSFDFPGSHRKPRLSSWIGYAAAACVVVAIVLPMSLHRLANERPTESVAVGSQMMSAERELEGAFAMISQHFSSSDPNLIDLVQ